MSHFTKLKTKITDLEMLKRTLQQLQLEFREERIVMRDANGQQEEVEVFVSDLGAECGFKMEDGVYHCIGQHAIVSLVLPQIMQRYAYNVVHSQLDALGFRVDQEFSESSLDRVGSEIHLVMRRAI